MIVIGIDPGLNGSIVALTDTGVVCEIVDMPTLSMAKGRDKKKQVYDIPAICRDIKGWDEVYLCMEKMQTMPPGFRAQASFGLGYCQGLFEGIAGALKIPYELVIPKVWQKHFGITGAKGDKKVQSYMVATKLFPDAPLTGPRGGKKDGRSDALLIAEWCRRRLKNESQ
jgi:hypothetical protein